MLKSLGGKIVPGFIILKLRELFFEIITTVDLCYNITLKRLFVVATIFRLPKTRPVNTGKPHYGSNVATKPLEKLLQRGPTQSYTF